MVVCRTFGYDDGNWHKLPQNFTTHLHDKLHKWLFNPVNRYKVLQYIADKKGFELNRDFGSIVDIEKPIFVKDSRRFITDDIVDLVSLQHCGTSKNDIGLTSIKSFNGKELKVIRGAIYRRAIIDIKPNLTNSVSSAIGQIRTYTHFLRYCRWENGVKKGNQSSPDMMLLTLSTDTDELKF